MSGSALERAAAALRSRPAYVTGVALIVALAAALGTWNAIKYPPYAGYDNEGNYEYAIIIQDERRLPVAGELSNYYKPPGFFAVAGWLVSQKDNRDDGRKYVQYFNAALYVASALLVLAFAALVFPGRRALHLFAGGFFVLLPAVPKLAAAFHPAIMSVFFAAAALVLATWMLVRRRFDVLPSLGLAVILVGGVLVSIQNLWVYGAVLLGFLPGAIRARGSRLRASIPIAVVLGATILLAAPFYVKQAAKYGDPVLGLRSSNHVKSFFERRPSWFYTPGSRELFTEPWRPHFSNRFLPQSYAELWGDYFGQWNWSGDVATPPEGRAKRDLVQQSFLGLLPTLLGVGGWIALMIALFRERFARPELVALTVLPAAALLGFLYYTIGYPTYDGDTIKATYMVVAAPAWALTFAWAADSLRRRPVIGLPLVFLLVGSALLSLPFLTYFDPLWGLL